MSIYTLKWYNILLIYKITNIIQIKIYVKY